MRSDATTRAEPRPYLGKNGLTAEVHVYEPHRIGLPPMRPYLRELWRRREFAFELARTNLRAQHFTTVLGQLWLILNPLFLALIYFVLVEIVRGGSRGTEFLAHLMLGLFAFRLVSMSVKQGARSVVGGGRLILNIAFPRTLLPLASVMTAFMRFVPTMIVYAVVHVIAGLPVGPQLLWSLTIVALLLVLATGASMIAAAVQVYFRDLRNILTYFLRIWLYASPVLYYADEVPERFKPILAVNPMYPLLGSLSDAVNRGENPSAAFLVWGFAWAVGIFVIGALFFVSREREFAVRL
jgi:ABC-type polysaccharide/polyol phosphate export permease